jgi:peptidoglycan hydrolase-like protein with peptidoglycan-binding domain
VVVAAVARGWEIADADSVVEARTRGAVAQLERILGVAPAGIERVVELLERAVAPLTVAGHPMFAGLLGLTMPARGLLDGEAVTSAGREVREAVESATDEACASMTDALGADLIELVAWLQSWGAAVREAHGYYPSSPQEAVLSPAVDAWMSRNGLRPFGATAAAG